MTHDEAVGWLPGWVDGRLPESEVARVGNHVGGCDECRSLAEGYRVIAEFLRADAASRDESHPSSEALVAYATGLARIDPAEHLGVARHVVTCASCASDVDATREAERQHRSVAVGKTGLVRIATRPTWRAFAAAAAAVLAAVAVGYPLYRALGRSTDASSGALPGAGWSGVVALPVVSSTLRGGADEVPTVRVPPSQPVVAFALSLPADAEIQSSAALTLEVVAGSGESVWRQEIAPGRLMALSGASGAVLVVVPSSAMKPGDFTIRLRRTSSVGGAPLLEAPVRIVR